MSAGENQVGGTHYSKTKIDPKDFCIGNDMGGCELSIIKYVTRWKEKGGFDDLRKARQYVGYLLDNSDHLNALRFKIPFRDNTKITAHQYVEANNLDGFEKEVVRQIYFWHFNHQVLCLDLALSALDAGMRQILEDDLK